MKIKKFDIRIARYYGDMRQSKFLLNLADHMNNNFEQLQNHIDCLENQVRNLSDEITKIIMERDGL